MNGATKSPASLRVVNLQASNLLRLRAVEITPRDGEPVTLGGRNAQGKTSVLEAIVIGLQGKRAAPPRPVREGARSADIVLDLGDLIVERTIRKGGDHALTVRRPDGSTVERPQALLDRLYGAVALDPLAFSRMQPREQGEALRRVLGLDFTTLDRERAGAYEQRTEEGRALKHAEAVLAEAPQRVRDAPAGEVSVAALTAEWERRRAVNAQAERLDGAAEEADQRADAAEEAVAEAEKTLERARRAHATAEAAKKEARRFAKDAPREDAEAARADLLAAEGINRAVRANSDRAAAEADVGAYREAVERLTAKIEGIDAQKREALAAAQFPVPGLAFAEDGAVLLNGLPLAQASQAEQVRLGVAIGAAQNPDLRVVLVRDGSLLDPESMAALVALAREQKCQLWIEDARTTDPTAVIIEDGAVATPPAASGEDA